MQFGYMAETVAVESFNKFTLTGKFNTPRFSVTKNNGLNSLTIMDISKEDEAMYFCQAGGVYAIEFTDGIVLMVKGNVRISHLVCLPCPHQYTHNLSNLFMSQISQISRNLSAWNKLQRPNPVSWVSWWLSSVRCSLRMKKTRSVQMDTACTGSELGQENPIRASCTLTATGVKRRRTQAVSTGCPEPYKSLIMRPSTAPWTYVERSCSVKELKCSHVCFSHIIITLCVFDALLLPLSIGYRKQENEIKKNTQEQENDPNELFFKLIILNATCQQGQEVCQAHRLGKTEQVCAASQQHRMAVERLVSSFHVYSLPVTALFLSLLFAACVLVFLT